jgi:hypothetical protein
MYIWWFTVFNTNLHCLWTKRELTEMSSVWIKQNIFFYYYKCLAKFHSKLFCVFQGFSFNDNVSMIIVFIIHSVVKGVG